MQCFELMRITEYVSERSEYVFVLFYLSWTTNSTLFFLLRGCINIIYRNLFHVVHIYKLNILRTLPCVSVEELEVLFEKKNIWIHNISANPFCIHNFFFYCKEKKYNAIVTFFSIHIDYCYLLSMKTEYISQIRYQ